MINIERSPDVWLAALDESHDLLSKAVASLDKAEYEGPSFASEWSIAQVLSHLGSGVEIFSLMLEAGLKQEGAPGAEQFKPVWERWNTKDADAQVQEALHFDAALLEQMNALDDAKRSDWHLSMFGGDQNLAGFLRLRLGEHAFHTWDIVVMRDQSATLSPLAVELLIDALDQTAARAGKQTPSPLQIMIITHQPDRTFILRSDPDGVQLSRSTRSDGVEADARLELSAEALIRLVYGRLDPNHTPAMTAEGVCLDVLRRVFPGF